ncbi:Lysine ketoglutarate reductase (LOR) (LKR) / Saccharopine dehydrogenase [hydrothermal vent metagenome]|uniref:Saccharopine dehydrogenase [NAD(+), L-lysine-forming] n=1 Tax=hydrothermal vent metagenome TaxID=652676 RepID=A0A3B0TY73_9ZZZZ
MKIGILRETRRWKDRRAAITPATAREIMKRWPGIEIYAQPSDTRVFKEGEYIEAGVKITDSLSHCDILFGVKEVAEEALIPGKTYIIFAHVAKKQEHNRAFFREMARKKITLLDYEYFTKKNGARVVAFGHWAGVVGAYYAIMGIMKRFANVEIPHPSTFYDAGELNRFLKTFKIPPLRVVITGDGRVGQGAASVLKAHGIRQVSSEEFLTNDFSEAVFCMLPFFDYVKPKDEKVAGYNDFFTMPGEFESTFIPYTQKADVHIPCHFWDPASPIFFSKEDMQKPWFKIRLVADISCDVPGPVASTIRTSTHGQPFYDVDKNSLKEKEAFSGKDNITVVAVDNLPTALPLNASEAFASNLLENVFPYLFGNDSEGVVERATILRDGELTKRYKYLEDFLKG